jgi:hypothetical protein
MNAIDLRDAMKRFIREVMWITDDWCGNVDGGDLQGLAEKHGLIERQEMKEPCGPQCACRDMLGEDEFPVQCYQYVDGLRHED